MAIKKLMAATAITLGLAFGLSAQFNAAAANETTLTTTAEAANQNDPSVTVASQAQLSAQLFGAIKGVDDYFFSDTHPARTNPDTYDRNTDPVITGAIDTILKSLAGGADANYIDPQTGTSAFAAGLWIAYELDRPDIVKAFLDAGADPHQQMPGTMPVLRAEKSFLDYDFVPDIDPAKGLTAMDHAINALMESQMLHANDAGSVAHIQTAIAINKMLLDAGLTINDARQLPPERLKLGHAGFAIGTFYGALMLENGLITNDEINAVFGVDAATIAPIQGLSAIDRAFLERYGAPIIDFTDALPGGDEPYTAKAGDTLESVATRFQSTMGVQGGYDAALQKLAAENGITPDASGVTALTEGQKILVPTAVNIQIGSRSIPGPFDAFFGMVERVWQRTGLADQEAAFEKILEANRIVTFEDFFSYYKAGKPFAIPVFDAAGNQVSTFNETLTAADAVKTYVQGAMRSHYDKNATYEQVLEELARMNGNTVQEVLNGAWGLELCEEQDSEKLQSACKTLTMPYLNDTYSHRQAMQPPATYDPNYSVYRFVVEGDEVGKLTDPSYHHKRTYGVVGATSYALNRDVDLSRFYALTEGLSQYPHPGMSEALRMLLNIDESSPLYGRIIFSHSMATAVEGTTADRMRQQRGEGTQEFEEARLFLDDLERTKPIVFYGAGNYHLNINGQGHGEGRYVQSYPLSHSPRSVNVGAVGHYEGLADPSEDVISPYSSYAADVCTELPPFMSDQQEGTSFATPETMALYGVFAEWYGNVLNFEEIWSVAMMTADRSFLDFDPVTGRVGGDQQHPKAVDSQFRTNGAGLPYHERCGAGAIDAVQWRAMLDKMVEFHRQVGSSPELRSFNLDAGDPAEVVTGLNGETEYVYRITVPQDMTLGKLTFLLPQDANKHSEVVIRSPAGFEIHLPKAHRTDIISTSAFNYEDVKAGDVIEIRTGYELGAEAGMVLRGQDDGNSIQMMRDYLRAQGVLPAPLQAMEGTKVTGPGASAGSFDMTPPLPRAPRGPGFILLLPQPPQGGQPPAPEVK